MTVPAPSEKVCKKLGKRHKTPVELASLLIRLVRSWHPQQDIILLADGGYAAVSLVQNCQKLGVTLISRLRLDASLYHFPEPRPAGKRGPKPKKGDRDLSPKQRLDDPLAVWTELEIPWYGVHNKCLEVVLVAPQRQRPGSHPLAAGPLPPRKLPTLCLLRLGRSAARGTLGPLCPALEPGPWFPRIEELRAQLGFETQRGWADKTVERSTPCLFGLFSLVVLLAQRLHPKALPVQQAAWYQKEEASFSDALAAVRLHLWTQAQRMPFGYRKYQNSTPDPHMRLIPQPIWNSLLQAVCYST